VRALDVDERNFSSDSQVYFTYLIIGQVRSSTSRHPPTVFNPTSDVFAKSLVDKIGLRTRNLTPFWAHAMGGWFLDVIGERMAEAVATKTLLSLYPVLLTDKKSL
jgi:hypothetical protein